MLLRVLEDVSRVEEDGDRVLLVESMKSRLLIDEDEDALIVVGMVLDGA